LPPARVGATPFRLIGGAATVEAAYHLALGCALLGKNQSIIIQIREPERVLETFEEQLEKLADVLLNKNS
jgi:hypothetical protein